MSDYEIFKDSLKLVVLYQSALEIMDNFKGTTLYKQSVKNTMKRLEKDIEKMILAPIAQLDSINSDMFSDIQNKVDVILDLNVDELAKLKIVIQEYREEELKEWQQEILDKENIE